MEPGLSHTVKSLLLKADFGITMPEIQSDLMLI